MRMMKSAPIKNPSVRRGDKSHAEREFKTIATNEANITPGVNIGFKYLDRVVKDDLSSVVVPENNSDIRAISPPDIKHSVAVGINATMNIAVCGRHSA